MGLILGITSNPICFANRFFWGMLLRSHNPEVSGTCVVCDYRGTTFMALSRVHFCLCCVLLPSICKIQPEPTGRLVDRT